MVGRCRRWYARLEIGEKEIDYDPHRLHTNDALAVKKRNKGPIAPTILREGGRPDQLAEALAAAQRRGELFKDNLLNDPEMLTTGSMADRLGMSEKAIRRKRKRHEMLGLKFAKRTIRYPACQVLEDGQIVPGLARLFAALGDDSWSVYRFLLQRHSELGGGRAIDALRRGQVEAVIAAAENVAMGAFA